MGDRWDWEAEDALATGSVDVSTENGTFPLEAFEETFRLLIGHLDIPDDDRLWQDFCRRARERPGSFVLNLLVATLSGDDGNVFAADWKDRETLEWSVERAVAAVGVEGAVPWASESSSPLENAVIAVDSWLRPQGYRAVIFVAGWDQVAGAIVISDRLEALVTAGAKVSMGFFAAEGR